MFDRTAGQGNVAQNERFDAVGGADFMKNARRAGQFMIEEGFPLGFGRPLAYNDVARDPWPEPRGVAYKSWQPAEPSPIVAMMLARQRQ